MYSKRQHLYIAVSVQFFSDIIPSLHDYVQIATFAWLKHQVCAVYRVYLEIAVCVFYERCINIISIIKEQRKTPVIILAIVYLYVKSVRYVARYRVYVGVLDNRLRSLIVSHS